MTLPPGKYHVRAEKGAEYKKSEQDIEIRSGETAEVSLEVVRYSNMNQRGWYSGDLHNHRNPEEMALIARAEDLNVSPVITRHVGGPNRPGNQPFPKKDFIVVDATHVISLQNQEVERYPAADMAPLIY